MNETDNNMLKSAASLATFIKFNADTTALTKALYEFGMSIRMGTLQEIISSLKESKEYDDLIRKN